LDSTPPPPVASAPASLAIPEDFDPFAEPIPQTPASADERPGAIDFGPATREQNIDDIFDLAQLEGKDPFGVGALAEPRDDPDASPLLDPLVAIGASRPRKTPEVVQRDDTPEIYGSLRLPPVAPERGPVVEPDAPLAPEKTPPAAAQTPDSATTEALLREFLSGAGMPNLHIPGGLTPVLMRLLGQMFRESTQGTLDLLLARTTSKRELRSPLTTIVARENNPLKFSPSVEAAMTHLLALDHVTGFMAPLPALKDAYEDLRAHEFGVMAGMRAALAGALARFDPSRLERRLAQKSVLDALLPIHRDAKLWALFGELYAEISREAEDNFHSVFGAEFLKAYEEQIARLDQEGGKRND
jgi:type VI secretion system FHA domain protein